MPLLWSDLTAASQVALLKWPPIALLDGPTVAKLLGVSPSTLRNWRHRGGGPEPEPAELYGRGAPSPVYYRVSRMLQWLGAPPQKTAWEHERDWLVAHFTGWQFSDPNRKVEVTPEMSPLDTELAAAEVRANAADQLFNASAGIACWPARQPLQRQSFAFISS